MPHESLRQFLPIRAPASTDRFVCYLQVHLELFWSRYSSLLLLVTATPKDTTHQQQAGSLFGRVFSLRSFLLQLSTKVVSWCFMNEAEWGFYKVCRLAIEP